MPAFCSLCVSDEYTTGGVTDDGRRYVVCANVREHGPSGYMWEPTPKEEMLMQADGLGAELDIWSKLLECEPADGQPHSYGEVEDVFFERYPDKAAVLQSRYRHVWRERRRTEKGYFMSSYLLARVSDLIREKSLTVSYGPAEAPWSDYTRMASLLTKG
jgi:hypothetical protein